MDRKLKVILAANIMLVVMNFGIPVSLVHAKEPQRSDHLKTVVVDMEDGATGDAIVEASAKTASTILTKDWATSTGQTGTITSPGKIVNLSEILPADATIESITIYCPVNTRVTHSRYTIIKNYLIHNYGKEKDATVPFKRTDSPSSASRTYEFSGEPANTKLLVQIQGRIIQQDTGMDGFTVFGGKMIITYRSYVHDRK